MGGRETCFAAYDHDFARWSDSESENAPTYRDPDPTSALLDLCSVEGSRKRACLLWGRKARYILIPWCSRPLAVCDFGQIWSLRNTSPEVYPFECSVRRVAHQDSHLTSRLSNQWRPTNWEDAILAVYFFYDSGEPVPFRYLTPTRQVGPLPPPYESDMSPNIYLEFAIEDLASDTTRGLINAFGNAKRAFHLTIDSLLHQYGLFKRFRKANFPAKARLIDAVGMIPIGIMHNLNVERNLLEHEYAVPSKDRVKEAVDVTRLLLLATEKLVEATPQEAVIGWRNPAKHLLLQLEPQLGELNLFQISTPGKYKKNKGVSYIAGPIRSFEGRGFSEGVKLAKKAWKRIPLDKAHQAEWQPIIKELVNVQRRQASRHTVIDGENLTMTISVTLPLSLPEGISWHRLLDQVFENRADTTSKSDSSEEVGSSGLVTENK